VLEIFQSNYVKNGTSNWQKDLRQLREKWHYLTGCTSDILLKSESVVFITDWLAILKKIANSGCRFPTMEIALP